MKQMQTMKTFKIQIEQCRNYTWQGNLTTDGGAIAFKSELELLMAMDRLLSESERGTRQLLDTADQDRQK